MKLQPVADPFGLRWLEGGIERGGRVRHPEGTRIIDHQNHLDGVGIVDIDQVLHLPGEVDPRATCRDLNVPAALERFIPEEEIAHPWRSYS
jgi:hypothetical protein